MTTRLLALLVLLIVAAQLPGQTGTKGPEGSWQGTLEDGQKKLRLALTLSRNPDGTYSGSLDSLDQGATIPINIIKVEGDSVHLGLTTIDAVFDGKLNADRSEITGEFSQGRDILPLTFKRNSSATPSPSPAASPTASPQTPARPQRQIDVPVAVVIRTRQTDNKFKANLTSGEFS